MTNPRFLLSLALSFAFPLFASVDFDKQEKINGAVLRTGKTDAIRHYQGNSKKTYPHPLHAVKNGITNFPERCNNDYKGKRVLTDKGTDCKYHIEQSVESLVIKDIEGSWQKEPHEHERYLAARKTYRRGPYAHYDLVRVIEGQNEKGQSMTIISLQMLEDGEVNQYIRPSFKKDSFFNKRMETFILTAITPDTTELQYHYSAETDHWLLNKQLAVPQVFASIGQEIAQTFKAIESAAQTREPASH